MDYRVLVFGTRGVGKTSLCNSLTGEKREVNDAAQGVAFKTQTYAPFSKANPFSGNDTLHIVETSDSDKIFAKDLVKHEGFNLLIHVVRKGVRNQLDDENYKFFVKQLTKGNIPTLLVVTGCEVNIPNAELADWVEKNYEALSQGYNYQKIIATTFIKGGNQAWEAIYSPMRDESKYKVFTAIREYALDNPYKPKSLRETINEGAYELIAPISKTAAKIVTEKDGIADNFVDGIKKVALTEIGMQITLKVPDNLPDDVAKRK